MTVHISEDQRQGVLDRAVEAMRAVLACTPTTPGSEVAVANARAVETVTDAVTRGGFLHTQIAGLAGCSGLHVTEFIADDTRQAEALVIEVNAAENYLELVRTARRGHALRRLASRQHGVVTRVVEDLKVGRTTVYDWMDDAGMPRPREARRAAR